MLNLPPLSLYIHIPWCIKKCPYCDFNSYAEKGALPEEAYIKALMQDLQSECALVQGRPIQSIFFGGGTPSLFSPQAIQTILDNISKQLILAPNIEITLEANPGASEHAHFKDYKTAGVNRISLGVQSFEEDKLKILGRIHSSSDTFKALEALQAADFQYNIDLMYGLPHQTAEEALTDLKTAFQFDPHHLSWYHLTLEPNTLFHHQKPPLPPEEALEQMQEAGLALLAQQGLDQYEVSAFARAGYACQHNLNYWKFGDYLGIGAGAHGKITHPSDNTIIRYWKTRTPYDYLEKVHSKRAGQTLIPKEELPLEFMLNALRLNEGILSSVFEERTGIPYQTLSPILKKAEHLGLIQPDPNRILPSELGRRFLNDLIYLFSEY